MPSTLPHACHPFSSWRHHHHHPTAVDAAAAAYRYNHNMMEYYTCKNGSKSDAQSPTISFCLPLPLPLQKYQDFEGESICRQLAAAPPSHRSLLLSFYPPTHHILPVTFVSNVDRTICHTSHHCWWVNMIGWLSFEWLGKGGHSLRGHNLSAIGSNLT